MYGKGRLNSTSLNLLNEQLNSPNRNENFIKKICTKETRRFCLDYWPYRAQIKKYFNNYSINSPYAINYKKIGETTYNSKLLEINYNRNDCTACSILKFNTSSSKDNLLYEYYVGINYINNYLSIFPCFVETYSQLYIFNNYQEISQSVPDYGYDLVALDDVRKNMFGETFNTNEIIDPIENFTNNACLYAKNLNIGIMLQYYENFMSLYSNQNIPDIPNILMQIYFPLNVLKDEFTHYDLHSENVGIYKLYDGKKYITMTYHFDDGTIISFPTEYISKIIDYGRIIIPKLTAITLNVAKLLDIVC